MKQGSRDLKTPMKMATCYTITEVPTPSCRNPTINCYYILPTSQEKIGPRYLPTLSNSAHGSRHVASAFWEEKRAFLDQGYRKASSASTGHISNNRGAMTFQHAPTEFQFASIRPNTGLLPGLSRTQQLDQYHLPTRSTGSFMTTHK